MSNVKDQVIQMLQTPQLTNLATITLDGKPWTRYVMITSDDQFRIRSAVRIGTRKVEQIEANPEVHLTFGINDPADMNRPYVQIQGRARFTTDPGEKRAGWFDMLAYVFSGPDDPAYSVMIVEPYRVEFNAPGARTPEVWERP